MIRRLFRQWNKLPCPLCGSKKVVSKTTEVIQGTAAEAVIYCARCGHPINYWAYGYYQFPRTKMEAARRRIRTLFANIRERISRGCKRLLNGKRRTEK